MNTQNRGVFIRENPADYVLGSMTQIAVSRSVADWRPYEPDREMQHNNVCDFLVCVTMSALHAIVMNANFLLATKAMSDEAINFFTDNGYIKDSKFVPLSVRYNAKMNGTDVLKGNFPNAVAEAIRTVDGILPASDWSVTPDMTWEQYYAPIPQALADKAKKALWFFLIQYQVVPAGNMAISLPLSPIQVATEVCPGWDSGSTVPKCSGLPIQHCTLVTHREATGEWDNLDQYPPYEQKLSSDYEFPYNLQYVVSMKPLALRRGMRGENVLALQNKLNALGYKIPVMPDNGGIFGPITEAAVIDFQKKHALNPDGIVGDQTQAKLAAAPTNSIIDTITGVCTAQGIPSVLGIEVARAESGLNPKCVNRNTDSHKSIDRGLFQWNNYYHPEITDDMAFDPYQATMLFCQALKQNPKNLHAYWSASEHQWKLHVPATILKAYGILA